MKLFPAAACIVFISYSAYPARAAWQEAGVVSDSPTWSHQYAFPHYSEIFSASIVDPAPPSRTAEIEALIASFGGKRTAHDEANQRAFSNESFTLDFEVPRASAAAAATALVEKYKPSSFVHREFSNDETLLYPNPAELRAKMNALRDESTKLDPKQIPAILGLITYQEARYPPLIAFNERSENRAGIFVMISREPKPAFITGSSWEMERFDIQAATSAAKDLADPAFWARWPEGTCIVNMNPMQVTLIAKSPFEAAEKSQDILKNLGARPLRASCGLPSRLLPGEERSQIADASNWIVPDGNLKRVSKALSRLGTIAYFGPIEAHMWPSVSEMLDMKVRLLTEEFQKNSRSLAETPLIKTFVSAELKRLAPSVGIYKATKGTTAVRVLVIAPPAAAPH